MEFIILWFLFVSLAILAGVGTIVWWAVFVWAASKATVTAQQDLNRLLPNLQKQLEQYSQMSPDQRMLQQAQIYNLMSQTNRHMQRLENAQRQSYDAYVGNLQNMAATAGFDWTPPRY